MFSRLLTGVKPVKLRALVAPRTAFPGVRAFHATDAPKAALTFDERVTKADKDWAAYEKQVEESRKAGKEFRVEDMVRRFGLYPFAGLTAAALLSKEVIILDEGFLLAMEFSVWFFLAYTAGSQKFGAWAKEASAAIAAKDDLIWDVDIEAAKQWKIKQQWYLDYTSVIEEMSEEYKVALDKLYASKNLQLRHNAYHAVLAKLEQVKTQERTAAATAKAAVLDNALKAVRAEFAELDAKTDDIIIDNAIEKIGLTTHKQNTNETKAVYDARVAKDPVLKSFTKHVNAAQATHAKK